MEDQKVSTVASLGILFMLSIQQHNPKEPSKL